MSKRRAKPIDIDGLCKWAKADTEATLKRLEISKLFAKQGIGATAEELFGDVPATRLHKGDVTLAQGTLIDADGNGIFIIEGSLAVKGPLTFDSFFPSRVVSHEGSAGSSSRRSAGSRPAFRPPADHSRVRLKENG